MKPWKSIPDSTVIRLRNLKTIDPEGNDLLLGSEPIVIHRDVFVGIDDPMQARSKIYPNPTNGFIHNDIESATEAQIYSLQGHLLRHYT